MTWLALFVALALAFRLLLGAIWPRRERSADEILFYVFLRERTPVVLRGVQLHSDNPEMVADVLNRAAAMERLGHARSQLDA
jgi:hypothetical protein